jgi:hypothetical protein
MIMECPGAVGAQALRDHGRATGKYFARCLVDVRVGLRPAR